MSERERERKEKKGEKEEYTCTVYLSIMSALTGVIAIRTSM